MVQLQLQRGHCVGQRELEIILLKKFFTHGGWGCHDYCRSCRFLFPKASIEYYYYDQLGNTRSDNPDDLELWTIDRFVDEVEQVRVALGLQKIIL